MAFLDKSQKEGQEDQGEVKELKENIPSCLKIPPSSWEFLIWQFLISSQVGIMPEITAIKNYVFG